MANPTTDERNVDTHDPAGYAAFLRERAKANREIAELPREQWPYRPAVLQHWAFRFEQGAVLIERMAAALTEIATYPPGTFRPLADEIAIWKLATEGLGRTVDVPEKPSSCECLFGAAGEHYPGCPRRPASTRTTSR